MMRGHYLGDVLSTLNKGSTHCGTVCSIARSTNSPSLSLSTNVIPPGCGLTRPKIRHVRQLFKFNIVLNGSDIEAHFR